MNLLFFFRRLLLIERLVILRDQPLHRFAIDFENLVSFDLRRLGLAFSIQLVFDFPGDVGVIACLLLILEVFIGNDLKQAVHLVGGKLAIRTGREIGSIARH